MENTEIFYNKEYVIKLSKQSYKRLVRLIPHFNFSSTDNIADFGCGDGKLAHLIWKTINSYTGIDFSQEFINYANLEKNRLNIKNAKFICADITQFSASHIETFDKVFCLDFTEHVEDAELIEILKSIRSTLKIHGSLFIHTPNGKFIIERLKKYGLLKQQPEHIGIRTSDEYLKLLRESGFNQITIRYFSHYLFIIRWLQILSYIPVIGQWFKARLLIKCIKH